MPQYWMAARCGSTIPTGPFTRKLVKLVARLNWSAEDNERMRQSAEGPSASIENSELEHAGRPTHLAILRMFGAAYGRD